MSPGIAQGQPVQRRQIGQAQPQLHVEPATEQLPAVRIAVLFPAGRIRAAAERQRRAALHRHRVLQRKDRHRRAHQLHPPLPHRLPPPARGEDGEGGLDGVLVHVAHPAVDREVSRCSCRRRRHEQPAEAAREHAEVLEAQRPEQHDGDDIVPQLGASDVQPDAAAVPEQVVRPHLPVRRRLLAHDERGGGGEEPVLQRILRQIAACRSTAVQRRRARAREGLAAAVAAGALPRGARRGAALPHDLAACSPRSAARLSCCRAHARWSWCSPRCSVTGTAVPMAVCKIPPARAKHAIVSAARVPQAQRAKRKTQWSRTTRRLGRPWKGIH